jgi:biopolymer transport protein ExbD
MIKIKGRKDFLIALESVAMTDIVLNMFIFFFISFSLIYTFSPNRLSKLEIKLPKAQSAVELKGSEKIILSVSKSGAYYVNDEKTPSVNLKMAIKERLNTNPTMGILLRVDANAKFDSVAKALDVINELNIRQVSLATVKKDEKPGGAI